MQHNVLNPVLRIAIILMFLAILSALLPHLPMLSDLRLAQTGLSAAHLAQSIVQVIMVAALWTFARTFAPVLKNTMPNFPQSAALLNYVTFFVSVIIAYNAALPLVIHLISDDAWLFRLCFGLLALAPIVLISIMFSRHLDDIVTFLSKCASCQPAVPEAHCQPLTDPLGISSKQSGKGILVQPTNSLSASTNLSEDCDHQGSAPNKANTGGI